MSSTQSPSPAAVTARGWGWRHAGRSGWAVSQLDLRIEPGERVLLLGASGAGKSTLLRGLAGVLGGDDEGEQLGELRIDDASPTRARGRVGLLQQDPDAQLVLARLGDDVAFGCENLGVPTEEIWRRVPEALADVGLDLSLERSTSALSGGQKQRAALAGLLAMRPGLLLLDEPTANLDPEGARQIVDAVDRLLAMAPRTLVVVEHRVDVWLPLVDRVVVLGAEGGLLADGPADTVFERHRDTLLDAGVWVPGWSAPVPSTRAPKSTDVLLDATDVSVARVKGSPVLSGVDVSVRATRALAITGPNGAGKSTLALALGGLTPPAAGRIAASPALAEGLRPEPHRWTSRQLLTRIGSVFQDPEHQFLTGRVHSELGLGPRLVHEGGGPRIATADLLERLRLDDLVDANPFTLSGGQKRRLSVATALATGPRVLVLDEPTFGQDLRTWRELVALLAELRAEGTAIVAVSHDEPFVRAVADEVLALPAREGVLA